MISALLTTPFNYLFIKNKLKKQLRKNFNLDKNIMMGYGMKISGAEFTEDQSMKKSEKCLIYLPDIRGESSETKRFVIGRKTRD